MARSRRLASRKGYAWIVAALTLVVASAVVLQRSGQGAQANSAPYLGLMNTGMPTAPQPYMPSGFAVTKHLRGSAYNTAPFDGGTSMIADHGADCAGPPATHTESGAYATMLFVCHGHIMTAINSDHNGYGEILFQPDQLVDWSAGPATVSISVSTFKTSGRDWFSFMLVPFNEQEAIVTDGQEAEPIRMPRDTVTWGTCPNNGIAFCDASETINSVNQDVPNHDAWTNLEDIVGASKTIRTPITATISRTHFTLVAGGHTFADGDFAVPLPFTQAVFQVMHHGYTASKDGCQYVPKEQAALGLCQAPDTWHWSNLAISSAVPYALDMAMPDAAGDHAGLGHSITFAPAPADAHLRFQWFDACCHGVSGSISFDGGQTWAALHVQDMQNPAGDNPANGSNIWQPVPQGATSALLRGSSGWYARDFYVMAQGAGGGTTSAPTTPASAPTTTPMPPMSAPSPAPLPINGVPCTVTINGTTRTGTCSGMFSPG
jgi:hypothetical protein